MLQFNSHATDQDIVSEVLRRSGAGTVDNFPLVDIARLSNFFLDWYYGLAFLYGKGLNYDDETHTAPPIDTQKIVSGTNRYKLSDFTMDVVGTIRVEILSSAGKGLSLKKDTFSELDNGSRTNESGRVGWINKDTFQEKYVNADSGVPSSYIIYGNYVYFDKKPNYSESDGLLFYVNRPADQFASTDTTKTPGICHLHAELLCEYVAMRWKYDNKRINKNEWNDVLNWAEDIISKYFGQIISQDKKSRLGVRQESCR